MRLASFPRKRESRIDMGWIPDQVGNDNIWKISKFWTSLLIISFLVLPNLSLAAGVQCSKNGYTVATINGIFTDENGAVRNRDTLEYKLGKEYRGEIVDTEFLPNPPHLGGLGDIVKSVLQGLLDKETVNDYDLVEMLKSASEKVTTQKLLLVAHSQGNFYANSFYDTVAGRAGGVPAESIGVYSVATPSSRVAGGGRWITSDTDAVIADIVGRGLHRAIMKPNTHIALQPEDDSLGHDFTSIYLKYRGAEMIADIEHSLNKLQTNDLQDAQKPCLVAPPLTLTHKVEGALFAVADPVAGTGIGAVTSAVATIYDASAATTYMATALYNLADTAIIEKIAERTAALKKISFGAAEVVVNADWQKGQLSSLIAALDSLPRGLVDAAVVCLVDHPCVSSRLLETLLARFQEGAKLIVLPTYQGRRGHPVVFSAKLFDELRAAPLTVGARHVVHQHAADILEVPTDEEGVLLNINDRAAYEKILQKIPPR